MKSNLENNFLGDVERYPLWVSFIGSVACRAGVVWRRTSAKLNHGDSAEKRTAHLRYLTVFFLVENL